MDDVHIGILLSTPTPSTVHTIRSPDVINHSLLFILAFFFFLLLSFSFFPLPLGLTSPLRNKLSLEEEEEEEGWFLVVWLVERSNNDIIP